MLSKRPSGVLRGLLILAVLGVWLAIGAVGGQAQGQLSSVQTNDDASFLPQSAESTRAAQESAAFVDAESLPALVVAEGADGGSLSEQDLGDLRTWADAVPDLPLPGAGPGDPQTVGDVSTADPVVVPSKDGEAGLVVVSLDAATSSDGYGPDDESITNGVVEALRDASGDLQDAGLTVWVTGPAGFVADLVNAFGGIDTVLLLVALVAVLVILAVVYRSPVLPFMVILTAVFSLCLAGLVVYHLADAGTITLNGQAQGILSILVVGAAVDYSLLVVARYREELVHTRSTYAALRRAVRASLPPVAASAGTVIAGLLCLLLSDLASNRSLGPVAAIGISAAFLGALTFLPALLLVAGSRSRGIFWPRIPRYTGDQTDEGRTAEITTGADDRGTGVAVEGHRAWSRVASFVGRRDRAVWVVTALVLAGAAAFVPTLDASGTGDSEVFLTQVDSVDGEKVVGEHYEGLSAQPAVVVAPEGDADAVVRAAQGTEGVASVTPVTEQGAGTPGTPSDGPPLVVDGTVRIDVATSASSDSQAAVETVEELRDAVHEVSPDALVGGAAAERLDTQLAGERDLRVIVPVVLLVILAILMLLLRSVLAAALLVVANVLSFGAALGVSAVMFDHVFDFPGADPSVPLFAFCFLVALGVDYSIFLMTRVREETVRVGARLGVLRALAVTGSVITSAGVVLAATFAALGVIPLLFLAQIAFIVAFGVLLDTLVVRTLLVPALVHDIGRRTWWPSRLARPVPQHAADGPAPQAEPATMDR
ncbi:MMPL family transporter [Cellulomonas sp. PhB143]|uniref:MMPL family transporter n=1 Tax=Cellulomonas sp. PhB143 TaxID=2485186 RepID=UPI000F4969C2|nr:MMPL family transporter [Cellulomonas sp. PhB143]ROS73045.1 RND superfamily putative drug exporter [Cellulomonas sp. PhB143]